MNITKVQIHVNSKVENSVKAWADIIIDDEFIVKGLQIREDSEGFAFVTMPFRLKEVDHDRDQIRQDIAHPIRESCRKYIVTKVLDAYEETLNKTDDRSRTILSKSTNYQYEKTNH